MSKIIKKSDITTLVESTMKQAGILKEEDIDMGVTESKPDYIDLDKDGDKKESMKKASKDKEDIEEACDDMEESEEKLDVVSESTKKLAGQASEHGDVIFAIYPTSSS